MYRFFRKPLAHFFSLLLILSVLSGCQSPLRPAESPENASSESLHISDSSSLNSAASAERDAFSSQSDADEDADAHEKSESVPSTQVQYGKSYYTAEEVASYIHCYAELPPNYITKDEARRSGWSVSDTDGLVIGGDRFGNREKRLPVKSGRKYFEADIAAGYGENRGTQRLIYSNDGLIFFTDDHYESFTQLYGEFE